MTKEGLGILGFPDDVRVVAWLYNKIGSKNTPLNGSDLRLQRCFLGFNQSKILHYFSDNWHPMLIILVTSQEI